jgi:hypothetical protein
MASPFAPSKRWTHLYRLPIAVGHRRRCERDDAARQAQRHSSCPMSVESNSPIDMHNNRFASSRSSRIPKLTITARRAAEQDAMPTSSTSAPTQLHQTRHSYDASLCNIKSCQHIVSIDNSSEPPPTRERDQSAPQANRHSTCLMSIESNSLIQAHINRSASPNCSRIIEMTIATPRINKNDPTSTLCHKERQHRKSTSMKSLFVTNKHSTNHID